MGGSQAWGQAGGLGTPWAVAEARAIRVSRCHPREARLKGAQCVWAAACGLGQRLWEDLALVLLRAGDSGDRGGTGSRYKSRVDHALGLGVS